MKKNHNRFQKLSLLGITSLLVLSCGVSSAKKFNKGQITPDQLYIVDCLLPPQVRQLGQNHTYLAPRKPAKLSAHDCALRGGEYVAYDRASFSSAAKTWLPDAQKGSAKAQSYMGELYENGINGTADYKSAAMWYQKAVDQGYTPAMLNLGNLYEQGLGVEKDTTKAINLYRMASGVSDA
ncbi:MAG TPA: sel1 repeat family protein, partial [Oceanospirillales bacterium]|nr:sel1 repeat family protein [Oceanospirillales bacterium]